MEDHAATNSEHDRSWRDMARYRLSIARIPGGATALEVRDNRRGCPLLGWQGDVARHMLDSGVLPAEYCRAGCHGCDKSLVRRLIMAAAAAEMRLNAEPAAEPAIA